ncbi:MAG: response regulator [Planctomycetia bacterium 21-64-5]|nr:MAG: response regulator [Planctomycetia bacterium 21-64-5]HQU41373.1 response regulator [Pirellulales bacterium]HVA46983.1 response regulator [Pirellulales bacterium]
MTKRVLDVGQCSVDHAAIRRLIEGQFGAQMVQSQGIDDTLKRLADERFDLVLVNRKLDADYSDGLNVIRAIKAEASLSCTPVMLVSNYPDAQEAAVAAGAVPGFGKAELDQPATREKLRPHLSS